MSAQEEPKPKPKPKRRTKKEKGEDIEKEKIQIATEVIDNLPEEKEDSNFRLRCKMLHLTYKGWLIVSEFLDFIRDKVKNKKTKGKTVELKYWSVVLEQSDSKKQYQHTHAALAFNVSPDISDCRFFDYPKNRVTFNVKEVDGEIVDLGEELKEGAPITDVIHPNFVKIINAKHWDRVMMYHKKTGVPVETNWEKDEEMEGKISIAELQNCDTDFDVITLEQEKNIPLDKTGNYITAWRAAKNIPPEEDEKDKNIEEAEEFVKNFRPWQKELYNELQAHRNDDRTIIWYLDACGASGKSKFTSVIQNIYPAIMFTSSKMNDAAYILSNYIREHRGESPECIIINLDRTTGSYGGVYTILEAFKDRMFTSGKYQSQNITLTRNPKIVVMANTPPDENTMSLDRWDIRIIGSDSYTIENRVLGSAAEALYNQDIKDGIELSGKTWSIHQFDQLIPAFELQNSCLIEYKVATIHIEKRPLTQTERAAGKITIPPFSLRRKRQVRNLTDGINQIEMIMKNRDDNDELRNLTVEEKQTNYTSIISVSIRDMTPEEKESQISFSLEKTERKRKELEEWARLQRKGPKTSSQPKTS